MMVVASQKSEGILAICINYRQAGPAERCFRSGIMRATLVGESPTPGLSPAGVVPTIPDAGRPLLRPWCVRMPGGTPMLNRIFTRHFPAIAAMGLAMIAPSALAGGASKPAEQGLKVVQ